LVSSAYKRGIVPEADACVTTGSIGELLRREGLFSSLLNKWRKEAASDDGLQNKQRGPQADAAKAIDRRVAGLDNENAKLRKKIDRAEQIMSVQKKLCELLGLPLARQA
jgi:transposase